MTAQRGNNTATPADIERAQRAASTAWSERRTDRWQPPALRKLHAPYKDTYDLRLTAEDVDAIRGLLRWLDPGSTIKRRSSLDMERLAAIQQAVREADDA